QADRDPPGRHRAGSADRGRGTWDRGHETARAQLRSPPGRDAGRGHRALGRHARRARVTRAKVSRYLTVSRGSYEDAAGRKLKLVLGGRGGHLMSVPEAVGASLAESRVPEADDGLLQALAEAEVLVPAEEDEAGFVVQRNQAAAEDEANISFGLIPTS